MSKHVFRDDYEKEFSNVKHSRKGKSYAHCCYCDSDIKLEAMGKTAISAHNVTTKHKNMARSIASNQSMKQFLKAELHQLTWTARQQQQRVLGHFILPSISNHFFSMIALQISLKHFSLILT